ncbi:MAG: glycosyl hydrolase [Rikenellaceae bacterium]|nr:glycosyl hydrolase [Rikenellaceae bacterium]
MKRLAILLIGLFLCTACGDPTTWYPIEKEHRPYLRWWWLGSAVDSVSLSYNLEEFAEKGFGGVEITPIYGVQGNEENDIEYLSARWMAMLGHTLSEGKRLGLGIDMNNGTGWPFGGPTITHDHAARKFIIEKWSLKGGKTLAEKLQPRDEKQQPFATLVALQAVGGEERIDLTDKVNEAGELTWQSPAGKDWTLYALFSGRTLQKVKRAAPGGEGLVMNHYDSTTLHHYFARFEEAFASSGVDYPDCFFNDSFEVYGSNWDEKLPARFEAMHGYSLIEHLPELAGEGDPDRSARLVSDYREALADLLLEHFTKPWTAWANQHGAKTRNQAHGSPGNLVDLYAAVDIPECESFGRSDLAIPGLRQDTIRKDNDGTPAVLKFASSAAHLTGKRTTSAEALTWLTEHFRTSLSQCKPELDLMFAAGVNHIVFHGAPYSPKEAAWPAWRFYASINMSPTAAYWDHTKPLTEYVARCQSFLAAGEPDNDLLLYIPLYDIWHEQQDRPFLAFDIHKMDRTMPTLKATMDRIVAAGYDADYLSDKLLLGLSVKEGMICTAAGTRYRALLIPACHKLPTESLEKLLALADEGAKILFTEHYPDDLPGLGREAERSRFAELLAALPTVDSFATTATHPCGRGSIITGTTLDEVIAAAEIVAEPFKRDFGGTMLRRRNEIGGHNYFLSMLCDNPIDGWVTLATEAATILIFDPMTGRIGRAESRPNDDGTTAVRLQLAPGESLLLKTSPRKLNTAPWPYIERMGTAIALNSGWSIDFPASEPAIEGVFQTDTLTDWTRLADPRAQVNCAAGRYTTRFTIDDPTTADGWLLDLGDVRESARVTINGVEIATLVTVPFRCTIAPEQLKAGENLLEVEVQNLPSNRIADYERRGIVWRIFKDTNINSVVYRKPFSFAIWPTDPAGLCSTAKITPIYYTKTTE